MPTKSGWVFVGFVAAIVGLSTEPALAEKWVPVADNMKVVDVDSLIREGSRVYYNSRDYYPEDGEASMGSMYKHRVDCSQNLNASFILEVQNGRLEWSSYTVSSNTSDASVARYACTHK